MAKQKNKTITVTLEVEPPYTNFAVLTFGGGAKGGVALTSRPLELHDKEVIHVGEHGGIEQMSKTEAKRRSNEAKGANKKDAEND